MVCYRLNPALKGEASAGHPSEPSRELTVNENDREKRGMGSAYCRMTQTSSMAPSRRKASELTDSPSKAAR